MGEGSKRGPAVSRRALPRDRQVLPPLLAVLAVGGLGVGVWAGAANYLPDGRSVEPMNTVAHVRALSPVSACLLTDSSGISRKPASDVWAGLQDAAAEAKVRATFLPLVNAGSPGDQVNALIAQGCNLILAVGTKPTAAVKSAVDRAPTSIHFAATGSAAGGRISGFDVSRAGAKALASDSFRTIGGSTS